MPVTHTGFRGQCVLLKVNRCYVLPWLFQLRENFKNNSALNEEEAGSYAETWANENGYTFVVE